MSKEKEGSIKNFVNKLLNSEPQNPKSIHLEIDSDEQNVESGFKCLIEIFTLMMKYLYGNNSGQVNLSNLTEEEIIVVINYYKSFGYQLYVQINENGKEIYTNYTGQSADDNKEKDTLLNHYLNINSKGKIYKIFFDFL
jgi:hypothetical protein